MSRIYLWGNLYYVDQAGVRPKLTETERAQTAQAKIRRLADTVRQTAHESTETLWGAALDVLDMDTARCFEQALTALVELGNHSKAMGMVAGLFTLCGVEITMDFVACQKYPAVMRMFLLEFLAETDEYLTDRDIAELMYTPNEGD
ncbi:MAG: hypothetical protein K2K53_00805 [Oscillospiraceae bacterium]|nr:hypothetical protein [Oscillospiraceae bacterium]